MASLHWTGRFADPAAERAYQVAQLAGTRSLGQLLVLSVLALEAVFAVLDLTNYGPTATGWTACGVRLLSAALSAGCWFWLGAVTDPARLGRVFAAWVPPTVLLNLGVLAALPGNHLGAAGALSVGVVLVYLLPLRLGWCAAAGLLVSGLYLGVLMTQRSPVAGHTLIDAAAGFVMANGVGAAVGRRLQADRRGQHAAGQELAATAAELRTLRGLLPICAFCKQIRDDAGRWQRVEAYIQARTDARFTHGICPGCLASEYGLTLDGGGAATVAR